MASSPPAKKSSFRGRFLSPVREFGQELREIIRGRSGSANSRAPSPQPSALPLPSPMPLSPPAPQSRDLNQVDSATWAGLRVTLEGLYKTSELIPPLRPVIGSLLSSLDTFQKSLLDTLSSMDLARYNSKLALSVSRRQCTEATRTAILDSEMYAWADDPSREKIYYMEGMAGTGKTTIACTASATLESRGQLAAGFFCTRASAECRDANRIFPTIAYQLARLSTPFRSALCRALEKDKELASLDIATQFSRLIEQPLLVVKDRVANNLVVVIDALDECDNGDAVGTVIDMLFSSGGRLPIKFLITSRPEPSVRDKIVAQDLVLRSILYLHNVEKSLVRADVELYLHEELEFMSPDPAKIKQLAEQADNLFIYAATAVRYIRPGGKTVVNSQQRLETMLSLSSVSQKKHEQIDALYSAILGAALDDPNLEPEETEYRRRVLWTAVWVQEPISIEVLTALVGSSNENLTETALQPLREVIGLKRRIDDNISRTLLYACRHWTGHLHLAAVSSDMCVTIEEFLSERLLSWMEVMNLKGWIALGGAILSIVERWLITAGAAAHVLALCHEVQRFVVTYASHPISDATPHIYISALALFPDSTLLRECYRQKVHGLIEASGTAIKWIERGALATWVSKGAGVYICYSPDSTRIAYLTGNHDLQVHDATSGRIIPKQSPRVSQRPPPPTMPEDFQIPGLKLASAWTAAPRYKCLWFSRDSRRIYACDSSGCINTWSTADMTLVDSPFDHFNLSADSKDVVRLCLGTDRIAVHSADKIIVWDLSHGAAFVLTQLESMHLTSLAISLDDTIVAIAYYTLRETRFSFIDIWDISTNTPTCVANIHCPGHNSIHELAFSPDSTRIASVSAVGAIWVCDGRDGTWLVDPFMAHAEITKSISFSPSGEFILSCSIDQTVKLWNSSTGLPVGEPYIGHAGSVNSAAFSPDGSRIISCSDDCTIRVWSFSIPVHWQGPSTGPQTHTGTPTTACFSPNGMYIVAGCSDSNVRVWETDKGEPWETDKGEPVLPPLKGHREEILSISISPDGTRIASGSKDKSIRVWNMSTGLLIAGPMEGHSDWVNSVQFSPDGAYIASGSEDRTVQLWDASNGLPLRTPLEGHSLGVKTVAFSPNGALLASGGEDRVVRLWDISAKGDRVPSARALRGHARTVNQITFSYDCTLLVWNPNIGSVVYSLSQEHPVSSVKFSKNGLFLASGSANGPVQVWAAEDGAPLISFGGHSKDITSVDFSPDGAHIVSSSTDNTILWAAEDGTPLISFGGHSKDITSVDFSPDGAHIVSSSADNTIRLSTMEPALPLHPALAGPWTAQRNGWFVNERNQLLFWVPADIIDAFPRPFNVIVIGLPGSLRVNYGNVALGEQWASCYGDN
ncbi:hypothetical protein RSAG8_13187, partial [Rhizoctonia solani AG-8 WAC10335]